MLVIGDCTFNGFNLSVSDKYRVIFNEWKIVDSSESQLNHCFGLEIHLLGKFHGIMGTGIPDGGLLRYRKWVPQNCRRCSRHVMCCRRCYFLEVWHSSTWIQYTGRAFTLLIDDTDPEFIRQKNCFQYDAFRDFPCQILKPNLPLTQKWCRKCRVMKICKMYYLKSKLCDILNKWRKI